MQTRFVKLICDVYCKWQGTPPRYRAYINGELFTERTWIWNGVYLEEEFQIEAPPGVYEIKYELVDSSDAGLKVRNIRVATGPGRINKMQQLEIHDEGV
jgi:hypothetical protein